MFADNLRDRVSEEAMLLNKIVDHDLCFCFVGMDELNKFEQALRSNMGSYDLDLSRERNTARVLLQFTHALEQPPAPGGALPARRSLRRGTCSSR